MALVYPDCRLDQQILYTAIENRLSHYIFSGQSVFNKDWLVFVTFSKYFFLSFTEKSRANDRSSFFINLISKFASSPKAKETKKAAQKSKLMALLSHKTMHLGPKAINFAHFWGCLRAAEAVNIC